MAFISHDLSVIRGDLRPRLCACAHGGVVEEGACERVFAAPKRRIHAHADRRHSAARDRSRLAERDVAAEARALPGKKAKRARDHRRSRGRRLPKRHRAGGKDDRVRCANRLTGVDTFRLRPFCDGDVAAALSGPAHADGLPGLRGHDHTGITVPDINRPSDFFIDVLGCKKAMSFGPFADDKGDFHAGSGQRRSARGDHADHAWFAAVIGSNIELFQYHVARPEEHARRRTATSAATMLPSMSMTSRQRRNTSTAKA